MLLVKGQSSDQHLRNSPKGKVPVFFPGYCLRTYYLPVCLFLSVSNCVWLPVSLSVSVSVCVCLSMSLPVCFTHLLCLSLSCIMNTQHAHESLCICQHQMCTLLNKETQKWRERCLYLLTVSESHRCRNNCRWMSSCA